MTHLPVLGVPVESKALKGMDSLLSIAQMPGGIPVGTLAIGKAGAINAGLLAAAILATSDEALSRAPQGVARGADRERRRSTPNERSAAPRIDHRHPGRRPARPDARRRRRAARLSHPCARARRAESVAAQTASSYTRADYHSRIVLDEARRARAT